MLEKKKNEFGNEVNQDWKLNKRVTLPEDCNLDTIDVVCDKKKTIGSVIHVTELSLDFFNRIKMTKRIIFHLTVKSPYSM